VELRLTDVVVDVAGADLVYTCIRCGTHQRRAVPGAELELLVASGATLGVVTGGAQVDADSETGTVSQQPAPEP
jgi:hypothetical protein